MVAYFWNWRRHRPMDRRSRPRTQTARPAQQHNSLTRSFELAASTSPHLTDPLSGLLALGLSHLCRIHPSYEQTLCIRSILFSGRDDTAVLHACLLIAQHRDGVARCWLVCDASLAMSWPWRSRRSSAALLPHRGASFLPLFDSEAVDRPNFKGHRRQRSWLKAARHSHRALLLVGLLCISLSAAVTVAAALLWAGKDGPKPETDGPPIVQRVTPSTTLHRLSVITNAPSLAADPSSPSASSSKPDALSVLLCPASTDSHVLPRGTEWLTSSQPHYCGSLDPHGTVSVCDDPPSASSSFTLRRGTGYGLPTRQYTTEARRWDSYYEHDAAVRDSVQWMDEYDYYNATQRAARLPDHYQPTSAPWYEMHLSSTGVGAGWRLMVHEAQWRLSSAAAVDGVDLLVSVVPIAAYWDTVGPHTLDLSYTNHSLAEAILDNMLCSFTADYRGDGEADDDVRAASEHISNASPLPVSYTANPLILATSHHIVHCPLPSLPRSVHQSLTRGNSDTDTPRLYLSSLSLHLDQPRSATFGVSTISLPLCLLRQRRVTVALVLSTQLGPPQLLRPQRLHAFLSYYMFLGVELFIVPERFGPLLDALLPYIAIGVVWYVRQPFLSAHHQPYMDQMPVLHSCVLRLQYAAEWLISVDVDEYVALDHPYWTEGAGVQPPSDDCWLSSDDAASDGGSMGCSSMLSAFLSQPGAEQLSLYNLANVPHWGLAPAVNETLQALSSSPLAATAYLSTLHPLDVWSRRCYSAEFHRFKLIFRPLHVLTVTMHDATLQPDCGVHGVGGKSVDAWQKYWGDAGLQRHREAILSISLTERAAVDQEALLQQLLDAAPVREDENGNLVVEVTMPELTIEHEVVQWHPSLHLVQLLCNDEMRQRTDVQLSFNLACCNVINATNGCFVDGAASFSAYLLATLTPLFPTVAQSNIHSPSHPRLPNPIPIWARPLPLSLFGVHVSHYICSHMAAVDLPHCTAANRTWPMGAMWGDSHSAGIAFNAQDDEEQSKLLLRAKLKHWQQQQTWRPWAVHGLERRVDGTPTVDGGDL